ncbi:MAG: hypothetical protein GWN07_32515 [Actinobacteria bacterium]|nr:hypothetical protein [Actinomycetota bacterium]NIS35476.1 hypothetical protein [Actinomycetota bacterium]NIU70147.1 hypothetical protein [Actinomycetota bacterium]NIW32029.1 hypothetical protein [Actinomycetota bacterium]NIX24280.1 hypothetical protein [Actinomycetota bacterium]
MPVPSLHAGLDLEWAFYGGVSSSSFDAGVAYPAALGGMSFVIDTTREWSHRSIPLLRPARDDEDPAGRQTLNPEAFWRRTFESWHFGAGQTHFDREGPFEQSNPYRFRRSKGIDIWEPYRLGLLNGTDDKLSGGTNASLAVAGDYLYAVDGTTLKYTQDITPGTPTFTTVTGGTAASFTSIASDGYNVLLAAGASGIDRTTRGAATKTNHITGTVTQVAWGKGRWLAVNGPSIYDITTLVGSGGALPAAHFTHPNTDWTWNSFTDGPTALYAAGWSGDKSLIYRLTLKEDGTGLNQPVVAGFLPDGERVHSLYGYLGLVLIGTSKGVRVGVVGGNGDLTIGAFIPTDGPVECFEGQETFVWFGWSDHDGTDAGLGRLNLATFTDTEDLAPAYTSDLMTGATGTVTSVVTFQGLRVFTVDDTTNGHIHAEDTTTLAASGELDSGVFDYGITDEKITLFLDTSHPGAHGGGHTVAISVDGAAFGSLGSFTHGFPLATGEARGHTFELRFTLTRDGTTPTDGGTLATAALRAQPAVALTEEIVVGLRIGPQLSRTDGFSVSVDSAEQFNHIRGLRETQQITSWLEGVQQWSVIVTDYQMDNEDVGTAHDQALGPRGTCMVRMKAVTV